jgi:hypothetical protein
MTADTPSVIFSELIERAMIPPETRLGGGLAALGVSPVTSAERQDAPKHHSVQTTSAAMPRNAACLPPAQPPRSTGMAGVSGARVVTCLFVAI